jgi:hypothetical protein
LQNSFNLFALLLKDVSSPHTDNFPPTEVFEEGLAANLSIVAAIHQPVSKGRVLDRLLVKIHSEALLGQGVEAVSLERPRLLHARKLDEWILVCGARRRVVDKRNQIIGILFVARQAINEEAVVLRLALEQVDHLV